jgi:hypothetical protein
MIKKEKRDELVIQALKEIRNARQYKRNRIRNWNANEDMYYGRKVKTNEARANVSLGKMQGFVHTILSKIDNPFTFKYKKGENSDMKKAKIMNALKDKDRSVGDWDFKDLLMKKQGVIYGRAVASYWAESPNGVYASVFDVIDVKDFLIDGNAGGWDVERALHLGWYNVTKTSAELKQGVKDGLYISTEVKALCDSSATGATMTEEDRAKNNRFQAYAGATKPTPVVTDVHKFWNWFTTDAETGKRFYMMLTEAGDCIRCEELKEVFESGLWPIWTWACFPDLTEFWTPSYCDYARETFQAQETSINQMLDNSEQVNKPQKAINVDYIKNLSQVKYKRDSYIEIEGKVAVNQAIQLLTVPSIDTPIKVYQTLDGINQTESGVTAGVKGVSQEDKVTIYEGNMQQASDRFGLFNRSYTQGYKRFAKLYKLGIMQHLVKKVAVTMIGIEGLEVEFVTRRDIKPNSDYEVLVEASDAETQANMSDQKSKEIFLSAYASNPTLYPDINQKTVFELRAQVAGFDEDDIKRLLDKSDLGASQILADADDIFLRLVKGGKPVKPYKLADVPFVQRLVNLYEKESDELKTDEAMRVEQYIQVVMKIATENMAKSLMMNSAKAGALPSNGQPPAGGMPPAGGNPPVPPPAGGGAPINNVPVPAQATALA